MEKINIEGMFTNGAFLRVGDFANFNFEYLNELAGGFRRQDGHGFIREIYVNKGGICNSCYTDLGLYTSDTDIMVVFEDGRCVFDWEVHAPRIIGMANWNTFLNNFFEHELNVLRKERLIKVLEIPHGRKVIPYIKSNHKDVYEFLIRTFSIRFYTAGLTEKNYSKKMFEQLSEYPLTQTNSIFYKLTHK